MSIVRPYGTTSIQRFEAQPPVDTSTVATDDVEMNYPTQSVFDSPKRVVSMRLGKSEWTPGITNAPIRVNKIARFSI